VHFQYKVGYHYVVVLPLFSIPREPVLKPELSTAHGHHEASAHCHNCGAETSGNFCALCGQETILHMPSAAEFLHEFVGHYVALESKLVGSLGRLLFRPGALTNEYIAGRRVRYVQPLRLYLSLSILFFAIIKLGHPSLLGSDVDTSQPLVVLHGAADAEKGGATSPKSVKPAALKPAAKPDAATTDSDDDDKDELMPWMEKKLPWIAHRFKHFSALDRAEQQRTVAEGFFHYAPYAVFCMMPFFALYMKVLYLGSGRRYGEHLLFALHTNAFAFLMLAVFALSPWGWARALLMLWTLAYLPLAMRRVYRRGRFATLWRWLLLMTAYSLTLLLAIMGSLALPMLA
jgi:hypothetical protein